MSSVASPLEAVNFDIVSLMKLAVFVVCFLGLYLLVNIARLIAKRLQPDYLGHATNQTATAIIGMEFAVIFVSILLLKTGVSSLTGFYILSILQLIAAITIFQSTRRHIKTTTPPAIDKNIPDNDLPTVSVCIPARNETDDLNECLKSLVASDYPKLEIIVLDDCSQEKRTPEIIRDFAHDGVKFIAGNEPPEHWLAKNFAYHQLAEEANGDILLFCGVDTRFENHSIRRLVNLMVQKNKMMFSTIPINVVTSGWNLWRLLVQPARYSWELSLPRRIINHPPVLSTCWLISKNVLDEAGGFESTTHKCVPESYFAKFAATNKDDYSFIQSDETIGISSHKSINEQRATAIRTRYPQLHRKPEMVALVTLLQLAILVWPTVIFIVSILRDQWLLTFLSGLTVLFTYLAYGLIVRLTYRKSMLLGWLILPVAALYDIYVLNYSMLKYEFDKVIWKDRNVCLPIMQIYPKLPES